MLRSYRSDEWSEWFAAAGTACPPIRGFIFDSSLTMAEAAAQQAGVALLRVLMFERELQQGRLVCPFDTSIGAGAYWLTRLKSKQETPAMLVFRHWLLANSSQETGK